MLLTTSKWKKEYIDYNELWIAEDDNKIQIQCGVKGEEFNEPWTDAYPDKNAQKYSIYLKINNSIVKELSFVSLNGGKIFVPMPDQIFEENNVRYIWNRRSLELKVSKIIGSYYSYDDIETLARISNIQIVG